MFRCDLLDIIHRDTLSMQMKHIGIRCSAKPIDLHDIGICMWMQLMNGRNNRGEEAEEDRMNGMLTDGRD